MVTSVRYKFVQNTTGAALTTSNFPNQTDGDDKQSKIIRHPLVAADFGGGAGQIDNAGGLILDILPINYNVLLFEVSVYRPSNVGGVIQYNSLDNQLASIDFVAHTFDTTEVFFWVDSENSLRVVDKGHAGDGALQVGDFIVGKVVMGTRQNPLDFL